MSRRLRGPGRNEEKPVQRPEASAPAKSEGLNTSLPQPPRKPLNSIYQPPMAHCSADFLEPFKSVPTCLSSEDLAQCVRKGPPIPACGLRPFPIHVPPRLMEAFRTLNTEPVLSGGSAVQVWTGRFDDIFQTHDLDFITHLRVRDLEQAGIALEEAGRHAEVDGVAVEFPTGPLGVGNIILDPTHDTILVPTDCGEPMRCIRPEVCVLDRLVLVAGDANSAAFLQASAVLMIQSENPGWDQEWLESSAPKAGLGRLWEHLKAEMVREHPSEEGVRQAIQIGWDQGFF